MRERERLKMRERNRKRESENERKREREREKKTLKAPLTPREYKKSGWNSNERRLGGWGCGEQDPKWDRVDRKE